MGATVAHALRSTEWFDAKMQDGVEKAAMVVGVWGRKASLSHVLRDRDRVEMYRPLTVDPKVARRERFQSQGSRGAGLFSKRRPGAKPGY